MNINKILDELDDGIENINYKDIQEYAKARELIDKTYEDIKKNYEFYSAKSNIKALVVGLVSFLIGYGIQYLGVD